MGKRQASNNIDVGVESGDGSKVRIALSQRLIVRIVVDLPQAIPPFKRTAHAYLSQSAANRLVSFLYEELAAMEHPHAQRVYQGKIIDKRIYGHIDRALQAAG